MKYIIKYIGQTPEREVIQHGRNTEYDERKY